MQAELDFRGEGAARGAGAAALEGLGYAHLQRADLAARHPVHVTLRVGRGYWNLRSFRALRALEPAFNAGRERFGFRLVQYSAQGNHLHLLVAAEGKELLARGMKGLEVRLARALNRMMRRKGRVFGERCHAYILKTPCEAARALRYVLMNFRPPRVPGASGPAPPSSTCSARCATSPPSRGRPRRSPALRPGCFASAATAPAEAPSLAEAWLVHRRRDGIHPDGGWLSLSWYAL